MLALLSPAKTLDFTTPTQAKSHTQPVFLSETQSLIDSCRLLSTQDIAELMSVSMKIAELNFERFAQFHTPFNLDNAKQALLAFKGDVYTGLDAQTMNEDDLSFAQEHIAMLSGLYGVLRPLDLMQAYRLEMGTKLNTTAGKTLYAFWGNKITTQINAWNEDKPIINLASNEYFKAIKPKQLNGELITIHFKENRGGAFKVVSFSAKKARGMMARFIIDNRIDQPEGIKAFNLDGYGFNTALSDYDNWAFTREQPSK